MVKGSLGMAMAKIIDALVKLSDAESQQISEGKL